MAVPEAKSAGASNGHISKTQRKKNKKQQPQLSNPEPRQEPAWLFPPQEENPVLNPKTKTEGEEADEIAEREHAIEYLKHHAVQAPHKQGPPPLLLQMVGSFLASYGFKNTGTVYTQEREQRVNMFGHQDMIGQELDPKMPTLVHIFNEWLATADPSLKIPAINRPKSEAENGTTEVEAESEATSSDAESEVKSEASSDSDSDATAVEKKPASKKAVEKVPVKKAEIKVQTNKKATKEKSPASSDSESDTSEEEKIIPTKAPVVPAPKTTVDNLVNKLKRKTSPNVPVAAPSSDTSSASSSSDSGSEPETSAKKPKLKAAATEPKAAAKPAPALHGAKSKAAPKQQKVAVSPSDSSSTSEQSSDSDGEKPAQAAKPQSKAPVKPSVNGASKVNGKKAAVLSDSSSSSSSSDSDSGALKKSKKNAKAIAAPEPAKRKRSASPKEVDATPAGKVAKKNHTPFQRIASDTKVDPRFSSNAYQAYDYADRAFKDLSVTKGKGFTKEKNKKKRGSYRGGMIDVAGGKGVKFDD